MKETTKESTTETTTKSTTVKTVETTTTLTEQEKSSQPTNTQHSSELKFIVTPKFDNVKKSNERKIKNNPWENEEGKYQYPSFQMSHVQRITYLKIIVPRIKSSFIAQCNIHLKTKNEGQLTTALAVPEVLTSFPFGVRNS